MKIFISWSGERSEALATALKEWLPLVLHYAEPWLSRSDIDAGGRWGVEIAKELEACNFGIICITRENRDAPWILFEAGALAKSMQDGKVIPLLLDLDKKEISGPLAQFQAKKVEQGRNQGANREPEQVRDKPHRGWNPREAFFDGLARHQRQNRGNP
jgi:TIR domain